MLLEPDLEFDGRLPRNPRHDKRLGLLATPPMHQGRPGVDPAAAPKYYSEHGPVLSPACEWGCALGFSLSRGPPLGHPLLIRTIDQI